MADENPFSSQVGGGGGGGGGGAPIPNAQPASQQSSFGGVAPVAAAPGASLTFTPNQWRLATGTPGWWILFCVLDIIVSVGLLADGLLMEAQVFGDSAVDTTNVVYLQTIFLGFYFFLFGAASLLCSIIWFTCLGKFVGFFYFMWGRGIAYLVMGTMSLNTPWSGTLTDGAPPIVWVGSIFQFVAALVLIVIGVVYIVCGFLPEVNKMYRPIAGGQNCRKPHITVTTREYWLGAEKFDLEVSQYAR